MLVNSLECFGEDYLPFENWKAICTTSAMGLGSVPPVRAGSKRSVGITFRIALVIRGLGEVTTSKVDITGMPSAPTLKRTRTSPSTSATCCGMRGVGRSPIRRARMGAAASLSPSPDWRILICAGVGANIDSAIGLELLPALAASESIREMTAVDRAGIVSGLTSIFFSGAFFEADE